MLKCALYRNYFVSHMLQEFAGLFSIVNKRNDAIMPTMMTTTTTTTTTTMTIIQSHLTVVADVIYLVIITLTPRRYSVMEYSKLITVKKIPLLRCSNNGSHYGEPQDETAADI